MRQVSTKSREKGERDVAVAYDGHVIGRTVMRIRNFSEFSNFRCIGIGPYSKANRGDLKTRSR